MVKCGVAQHLAVTLVAMLGACGLPLLATGAIGLVLLWFCIITLGSTSLTRCTGPVSCQKWYTLVTNDQTIDLLNDHASVKAKIG